METEREDAEMRNFLLRILSVWDTFNQRGLMTTDYIKRDETLTIECDHCGHIDEFNGSFPACIEQAKDHDWIIFKEGFQFTHFCDSDCRYEFDNQ